MNVEEAIARARDGDVQAYAQVVAEFQGPLRAFIAAYCPSREHVEEMAQAAFVRAFEQLERYQPGTRFYAWLKQIARNALLADFEARGREARGRERYLEYLQSLQAKEELEAQHRAAETEQADALRRCLDELPDHSRRLVHRRYEAGKSIAEIARDEGKAPGAVKVAFFRIHRALRMCAEKRKADAALELPGT